MNRLRGERGMWQRKKLRGIVRTWRKELKARIAEVAKLSSERKTTLDESLKTILFVDFS